MKTNTSFKLLTLAAAAVLALGGTARADSTLPADQPVTLPADSQGLLGQVYGTLTYSYVDLADVSTHADAFDFQLNKPLSFGLDGFLGYSYAQSGVVAGDRAKTNMLDGGLRAFSTHYNWGKPYVEAGVGYAWTRYAGVKDNSFVWEVAVGAEFQVAPKATVTPYVQYVDAPDLAGNNTWNFGVKANYWVESNWAVTAGIERDDDQNTSFTVGTNFRF
jgi:hypothetical protein